jgi:DNA-binding NarL/FixJ family response regulator
MLLERCATGDDASLHAAVGLDATTMAHDTGPSVGDELTAKELQLLELLDSPLTRREIGQRLYISLNTVKSRQRTLYRKLGAEDRNAAVRRAQDLGLLLSGALVATKRQCRNRPRECPLLPTPGGLLRNDGNAPG